MQEIIYTLTLVCIKISILLLYTGIFPSKSFGLLAKLVGVFVMLWGIAVLMVAIFSCIPVDAFWNIDKQPTAKCINQRNFFIGNSVPNIIADAVILTLPINQVWHLNMSRRSKVGVSIMFALGGFVVIASCVRMAFLLSISVEDPTCEFPFTISLLTELLTGVRHLLRHRRLDCYRAGRCDYQCLPANTPPTLGVCNQIRHEALR